MGKLLHFASPQREPPGGTGGGERVVENDQFRARQIDVQLL